ETSARTALPLLTQTVGSRVNRAGVAAAVRQAADRTNAHVTLLGVSSGTAGVVAYPIADSGLRSTPEPRHMQLAQSAASDGRATTGTAPDTGGRSGVVALPITFAGRVARVVLFSAPLSDVQSNV